MTKGQLREYRDLKVKRKQLEDELDAIESVLYSPRIQRMRQTPGAKAQGNAVEDMANKHLELMDYYRGKLAELAAKQRAVEYAIDRLPEKEQNVLRAYYIKGLKWEEVCVDVGYEWAQTHRYHSSGLQLLASMEEMAG